MPPPANLEVSPAYCLRLRHKGSSCRLCLKGCPTDAISLGESLAVDNSLCDGCGICASVCPTGVFELKDLPYESLPARVRKGSVVEFACSRVRPSRDTVTVPCLGYLDEAVLIATIGHGAQAVSLNFAACRRCENKSGLRVAVKSLKKANRMLALLGIPKMISATSGGLAGSHSAEGSEPSSRREFLSYLKEGARGMVASAVDGTPSDRKTSARTKVTLEPKLPKKRSLLLEHIKALNPPPSNWVKADGLPFVRVEISDRCDGCGICTTFCPTGALKSCDQGDRQVIDFKLGYCLACNLCSDICPQGAIAYSSHINPHHLATAARTILIEHRKSTCSQCGQSYIALSGSSLCLNCRKEKGLKEWLINMASTSGGEID
ncbi:MAG: 4Fe-4S binding protein [Dehalococcoidales bacterium]